MNDALFRTDPAQLGIVYEMAPCFAPIGYEGGKGATVDSVGDCVDGVAYNVVSATDCECLRGSR